MGEIKIKNNLLPCSTKHQIFIIKKQEIFKPKKNDHVAALRCYKALCCLGLWDYLKYLLKRPRGALP